MNTCRQQVPAPVVVATDDCAELEAIAALELAARVMQATGDPNAVNECIQRIGALKSFEINKAYYQRSFTSGQIAVCVVQNRHDRCAEWEPKVAEGSAGAAAAPRMTLAEAMRAAGARGFAQADGGQFTLNRTSAMQTRNCDVLDGYVFVGSMAK